MEHSQLTKNLEGVIAFPITPFKPDLSLDLDGLRSNLRVLAQHPLAAIVAGGGTGEIYSLTPAEQIDIIKATVREVQGRIPVIAGVGFNPAIATESARQAAAEGADGILAFPPYYPAPHDDGILDYYTSIANATPLGLIIYSRDWFNPSPELVSRLASIPTLVAWKDGQGDLRRYQMIRQRLGDRLYWIGGAGDDLVPGYYSIGLRTYTSSIANIAPKISLRLHALAASGNSAELSALMRNSVIPLYQFRARRKGYEVSVMKRMMDLIGLKGGPVRPPLVDVRKEEIEELRHLIDSMGINS